MANDGGDSGAVSPSIGGGDSIVIPGAPPVQAGIIGFPVMGPGTRSSQQQTQYTFKIDVGVAVSRCVVDVRGKDSVQVQLDGITPNLTGTNFPACTLQHKVSLDGYVFTKVTGTTDITGEGISSPINVSGWAFYAPEVTTKAPSSCLCSLAIHVKSNT